MAETPPDVIRIGAPAVSGSSQTVMGGPGIARVKGWLEEEFAKEGTRFEFPGFKGGAATVNQALGNGQIDFAYGGDLGGIISYAAGIRTRVIFPCGKLENAYLAVPAGSTIKSIQDLRGRRVGYFKGNYIHLQVIKILAEYGMTERDIKTVNLDYGTASAALINKDIDALFGGLEVMRLEEKGAKLVYSTQGKSPHLTGQAGILVREKFAEQYPKTIERMAKVWVKAALWGSDPANRDAVFHIWANGGRTYEQMKSNYGDIPLEVRLSPLLDPFFVNQYKETQNLARSLGLLRGQPVDIEKWFDPRFLNAALAELGLQKRWVPLNVQGQHILQ